MDPHLPFAVLADAVLVVHCLVVLFVVGGLPAVIIGNRNTLPSRGVGARYRPAPERLRDSVAAILAACRGRAD